jgi:hypothetical protein
MTHHATSKAHTMFVQSRLFHALALTTLGALSGCAAMDYTGNSERPARPAVEVTPLPDAPRGLSVVNSQTAKYAQWSSKETESCSYTEYYLGSSGDNLVAVYKYVFSVWVVKGKACTRRVEQLRALAPQCVVGSFPRGNPPIKYGYNQTVISQYGDEISRFEESRFGGRVLFRHNDDCNVQFIDN